MNKTFRIIEKQEKSYDQNSCNMRTRYFIEKKTKFLWLIPFWKTLGTYNDGFITFMFYSLGEAKDFLKNYCKKNSFKIIEEITCEKCL